MRDHTFKARCQPELLRSPAEANGGEAPWRQHLRELGFQSSRDGGPMHASLFETQRAKPPMQGVAVEGGVAMGDEAHSRACHQAERCCFGKPRSVTDSRLKVRINSRATTMTNGRR